MLQGRPAFHLVIPTGTKVIHRGDGRVGVVVHTPESPDHAYRVRFPDGEELSFRRDQLTIYRHEAAHIPAQTASSTWFRFVLYRCVVGSRAYGLATDESDYDRRGFYLPPAELHWSLAGVPEQIERGDEVYWEIEKFIRLALKSNPNVLECLYTPQVEFAHPIALELIAAREIFLSKYAHRTYNAYVLSQFKKLEQDLRVNGHIRWKHVMHLIRLQLSGLVLLREGFVPLEVDSYRERLQAIRLGQVPWDEVEQWRLDLHRQLDSALETTRLPDHPDYDKANELLLRARRFAAAPDYR